MKRILALLLALTMMTTLALAEAASPQYSAEVSALKTAVGAVRGQYGLSLTSMGLFFPTFTVEEGCTTIVFRSADYMPMDRLGVYTATITGDQVEVAWSHDDKDPQLWQSGDPESPCWGENQLQAYFAQGIVARDRWVQNYIAPDQKEVIFPDLLDTLEHTFIPTAHDAIPTDELKALAEAALTDVYALTEQELADLSPSIEDGLIQTPDGAQYWCLSYADVYGFFTLLIDAQTHEIFKLSLFTGGRG